jgi:hypothetical protein
MIAFNKFEGNGNKRALAYLRSIKELRRLESKLWGMFEGCLTVHLPHEII